MERAVAVRTAAAPKTWGTQGPNQGLGFRQLQVRVCRGYILLQLLLDDSVVRGPLLSLIPADRFVATEASGTDAE